MWRKEGQEKVNQGGKKQVMRKERRTERGQGGEDKKETRERQKERAGGQEMKKSNEISKKVKEGDKRGGREGGRRGHLGHHVAVTMAAVNLSLIGCWWSCSSLTNHQRRQTSRGLKDGQKKTWDRWDTDSDSDPYNHVFCVKMWNIWGNKTWTFMLYM